MSKIMKLIAAVALAVIGSSLFAYNGGYENSVVGSTTIDGVTYAGYGNNTLTARTESGTTIAANAYAQCKKLTSVSLANVTSIGNAAFAYSALTTVELPATLKTMGFIAFGGCANLTSVTINSTSFMTAADESKEPFRDCAKLATVTAKCAPPSWDFKKVFPRVTTVKTTSANLSAWQAKKYAGVTVSTVSTGYVIRYHKNDGGSDVIEVDNPSGETHSLAWQGQLGWDWKDYTFLGYATSATAKVPNYYNGQKVKDLAAKGKVLDLYGVWCKTPNAYYITFSKNDGSGTSATYSFEAGVTRSLIWQGQLGWVRTGYTFLGYATTATAKVPNYYNGQKVTDLVAKGKTLVLYGVWCKSADAYYIKFNKNDGSAASATYGFAKDVARSLVWQGQLGWTRAGYSFAGWATSANATTPNYYNGQKVTNLTTPGKTFNLYGVWVPVASAYYVKFNKNDGTGASGTYTFAKDVTRSLVWQGQLGWTRAGYTFLGWAKTASATTATYENGQKVVNLAAAGETVNLYAVWRKASANMSAPPKALTAAGPEPAFEPGYINGVISDGSGTFDLLLDDDGTAYLAVWTVDGNWAVECNADIVSDVLFLSFGNVQFVIRREDNGVACTLMDLNQVR